jgi:hypothetical protein
MVLDVVLEILWDSEMWERMLEDKVCFGGGNDGGNNIDGEMDAVA